TADKTTGSRFMDNKTSCGERILNYGNIEKVLIGGVLAIIMFLTICGNLLLIISLCNVKKLKQPSNYLIVSLAIADLSVAVAVMPFVSITELIGGQWIFGRVFCNIFIAMDVMCCTASIITLCVISIDRYLGITKPLTYPVRQNGRCMAKAVLYVWLLSASITLPPLFGWAQNINEDSMCLISQDLAYTIYSTAVAFYIPMFVTLTMYYRIYRAAKVSLRGGVAECVNLSHHLRSDRRNGSAGRRQQKAVATLGVVVGAFTVCWLPFFLLSTARPFVCGGSCSCVPLWLERTLLWLGYANSLVNPFINAFFNRDLRMTYRSIMCCHYRNINRFLTKRLLPQSEWLFYSTSPSSKAESECKCVNKTAGQK
uniref:G-protein coupled receptors family 1 profile domain-containing protein n=1 Tax=Electrophorus electricus TaxID=8005 RepID=A0AAY5ESZ9_ELEEL